jgi:hypothetical protein
VYSPADNCWGRRIKEDEACVNAMGGNEMHTEF